jgi:peptidoglycan/LPS O-acetylase OafA/YrhL
MTRVGSNSELLRFLLVGLVTWILAEASYRFFETRFLKLKERFAR